MSPSDQELPLPPGSSGLPLLGETLPFLRDPFGFIQARMGGGAIARTHLLGQNAVLLAGPDACEKWLDENLVQRDGSFPPHVLKLFGGRSLPLLDGEEHRSRRSLVMQAFTPEALASYLPVLEGLTRKALA